MPSFPASTGNANLIIIRIADLPDLFGCADRDCELARHTRFAGREARIRLLGLAAKVKEPGAKTVLTRLSVLVPLRSRVAHPYRGNRFSEAFALAKASGLMH